MTKIIQPYSQLDLAKDRAFVDQQYHSIFGKFVDWQNPQTYTEKIQVFKLSDECEALWSYTDKYEVRKFVEKTIGKEYLIPLLGVYATTVELKKDLPNLPNQFVLKTTHGSGWNIIVKDKNVLDWKETMSRLDDWLSKNYYSDYGKERQYRKIKPRVIVEKFICDKNDITNDYKLFCFQGQVEYIQVDFDRFTNHTRNFYGKDGEQIEMKWVYPRNSKSYSLPNNIQQMIDVAEQLSKDFDHVRVDLYSTDEKIYFGELTFTPENGMHDFNPKRMNIHLGSKWSLQTTLTNKFPDDYDLSKLITVNTGSFEMLVTPRYRQHYEVESYEPYSSQIVKSFLRDSDTFIDVGAHYGYFSLLANQVAQEVKIISVEPVKANFNILQKNIKSHHIEGWEGYNVALSSKKGSALFNVTEASDSAGFYSHPNTSSLEKVMIPTLSLLDVISGRAVDFIKMDVEGHEIACLENFDQILKTNLELKLLIEFNPKVQRSAGHDPKELLARLNELGLDIFFIDDVNFHHYRYEYGIHDWEAYLNNAGYCNLFCAPKGVFYSATFFCHSADLGGAERSLIDTVSGIRSQNIFPHVIIPGEGRIAPELKRLGISFSVIPYTWWATLEKNLSLSSLDDSGVKLLQNLPDIIKINSDIYFTITSVIPWGSITAKILNKPHVWEITEFGDIDHHLNYLSSLEQVKQSITNYSDKVIYISKALMNHYLPFSQNKNSELLYRNIFIDDASITAQVESIYTDAKSIKLLIIGYIKESKGQELAISATVKLLARNKNVELAVVGPTHEDRLFLSHLKSMVPNKYKTKIHFHDFTANPSAIIKQCDILLVCSKTEGYGRVVVEGMYQKKLVIGSSSGALPELIQNEETGLLFKPMDAVDLAKIIESAIQNQKRSDKIAQSGQKWAKSVANSDTRVKRLREIFVEEILKYKNISSSLQNYINSRSLITFVNQHKLQAQQLESQAQQIESQAQQLESQAQQIELRDKIATIQAEINRLEADLHKIKSAKFFKLWQGYNSLKKAFR